MPNTTEPGEKDAQLFGACAKNACEAGLSEPQSAALRRLHANLCTLVRFAYPLPNSVGGGALLLRLTACSANDEPSHVFNFAVCFATRHKVPESVLLALDAPQGNEAVIPVELRLPATLERESDNGPFYSDLTLCVRLIRLATDWSLSVLQVSDPAGRLNVFPVTGQQRFSQADLEEKRRQLLLQDAALRAARRAPWCRTRPERQRVA